MAIRDVKQSDLVKTATVMTTVAVVAMLLFAQEVSVATHCEPSFQLLNHTPLLLHLIFGELKAFVPLLQVFRMQ